MKRLSRMNGTDVRKPNRGSRAGSKGPYAAKRCALPVLASWFLAIGWLKAEPLPLTVLSVSNDTTAGFLVGADKDTIHISLVPSGGNTFKMPLANIQSMNIEEPKAWAPAMAAFQSGNYAEAAKQFDALAQTFASLVPLKDSYGSLARLQHLMSVRRLGRYDELASLLDRQLATPLVLSDFYAEEFDDLQGWALLGKKDWLALGSYVKRFEEEQPIQIVPQPPFKRLPSARQSHLAYFRAVWNEHQTKNLDHALLDYHRAMTLDLGADTNLTVKSAQAALRLVDTRLTATPQDKVLRDQAYSLAVICRDIGGKAALPAGFEKYLGKPAQGEAAPTPEPQKAAAPAAAKPAAPAKAVQPKMNK